MNNPGEAERLSSCSVGQVFAVHRFVFVETKTDGPRGLDPPNSLLKNVGYVSNVPDFPRNRAR